MNTFWCEARSAYSCRTRSGDTCLSCSPLTISIGTRVLATVSAFQPQVVTWGARRTPGSHVAPTGSDLIISDHTLSLAAGSYCSLQPTWRSQFAVNSSRDCVLIAGPSAGRCMGALAANLGED